MRWLWIDRPAGLLALAAAVVAFRQLLLPVAADVNAPDALFGLAQLVWLALCLLIPLAAALLLVRLIGRPRLGYTAPPSAARVPVVALTRRGDLRATLAAFDEGVDDLLSVPFSPEELVARVLAVLRRTALAGAALRPVLRVGELEIDILNRRVRPGTSELHLTALEQSLLYLLAANAGRLLTRDEIRLLTRDETLDHLWGVDYAAESNVVDRHVRNLRAKLQNDWRRCLPRRRGALAWGAGLRGAGLGRRPVLLGALLAGSGRAQLGDPLGVGMAPRPVLRQDALPVSEVVGAVVGRPLGLRGLRPCLGGAHGG